MKQVRAIQLALRLAALGVTITLGCQGLLGIDDAKPRATGDAGVAAVACKLPSDCSGGDVCLFATCSKPCKVDTDCATDFVCLPTTTKAGTACVSPGQASCTTSASVCVSGTTCIGGQCQIDCSSDKTVCRKDQVCSSSGACVGTTPGHEPGGTGGRDAGSSGGAPNGGASGAGGSQGGGGGLVSSGGSSGDGGAGGTDGGTVGPTTVGTVGHPCAPNGADACAGNHQRGQLVCTGGAWASNGTCSGGNNCDTSTGNVGFCNPIVTECSGKSPGTTFCRNAEKFECGPDLVTATSRERCPFVCTAGACAGECVPTTKDCGGGGGAGAGLVPRTCQADGTWLDGTACPYLCAAATGSCVAATCGDGKKNGNETDVDCGGSCGATCVAGKSCGGDGDCASSACVAGLCTVCKPAATQCSGTGIGVQTCTASGTWGTAVACSTANGTASCTAGACGIACKAGYGDCTTGNDGCETNLNGPATCGTTCANKVVCASPTTACAVGACVTPSCSGLQSNCGPSANQSCCASPIVSGGTFYRSYDGVTSGYTSQAYPATLSNFRLDTYEITVGRFRKFVAAYSQGMIAAGAGKNPNNATDPGWDVAWNASLPADATALTTAMQCGAAYQTWTPSAGPNENKAVNCINWYEAFAFCIWDGGRLPTEAEWDYAAAGGTDQRVYPWGAAAPDCTYANFGGPSFPTSACVLPGTGAINNVGSESPKGNGKYGQADLGGNVAEWTLDGYANPYAQISCMNCANTTATSLRVSRGGGLGNYALHLTSSYRGDFVDPAPPRVDTGSRCARTP